MKTLSKAIFITTLSLLTVVPAYAGHLSRDDDYRERLHQLEIRIDRGVGNSDLTHKQGKALKNEYRQIRRMAKEFREDGHMSRKERHRLDHVLERLNDQIKRYKHSNRERERNLKYQYQHENHGDRWEGEHYRR